MATSISEKLKIKPGYSLLTINAPADFKKSLDGLPAGVKITESAKNCDQIHWFVLNRKQLEKEMSKVMKLTKPGLTVCVYYPKGTSKIQTDLTRDKGWECLMAEEDKLTWIGLYSFDDTWSTFCFRGKTDADKKKDAKPKQEREIFKWADSTTKTITLPEDVADAFKKNKKAQGVFDALSFSNRREYIEWIVTAKREETRTERIKGTMERVLKGWKNPANRI
jgi:hypothetical protein